MIRQRGQNDDNINLRADNRFASSAYEVNNNHDGQDDDNENHNSGNDANDHCNL